MRKFRAKLKYKELADIEGMLTRLRELDYEASGEEDGWKKRAKNISKMISLVAEVKATVANEGEDERDEMKEVEEMAQDLADTLERRMEEKLLNLKIIYK